MWTCCVAVVPALASAQQPAGQSDDLHQAILRYAFRGDGGNVRVVAGRVPDDLAPNFHAPPGTRVLGTVIMNFGAVVLATTNASPDSLREEYTRAMAPRGWKPMEQFRPSGFVRSGSEVPIIFCRENAQLHVRYARRAGMPHDLYLDYRDGGGMCEAGAGGSRVVGFISESAEFPTLYDPVPPTSMPVSRCYANAGGRGGARATMTVVSSDSTAAGILRHYARQLEAAGWRPPGTSDVPSIATGKWVRPDTGGTAEVTLDVAQALPGSRCYRVEMRMSDRRPMR